MAVFIPFRAQEVVDDGGIWFGQNAITNNLIMCNKEKLMNPNAFRLGATRLWKILFDKGTNRIFSSWQLKMILLSVIQKQSIHF